MKKFWKYFGIAAAYFAAFLAIQTWASTAGSFFFLADLAKEQGELLLADTNQFLELYLNGITANLTNLILLSNVLTILGLWAFFAMRGKSFCREIGLGRTKASNLVLAVIYGFAMSYAVDLITGFLPIPEDMLEQFSDEHSMLWGGTPWLTFLSVALVGPVSEEICFRGLCYTRLKMGMRPICAGLISSVFFGIAHGNPVWFLVGFLAGMALYWIFETTGSLWTCIVVHVTNNTLANLYAMLPPDESLYMGLMISSVPLLLLSGFLLYLTNRKPAEPIQYSM